jgi:hypothetical protein
MTATLETSALVSQPVNRAAAVEAALRAFQDEGSEYACMWVDFAKAIRDNPASWEAAYSAVAAITSGNAVREIMSAVGFGMVAGMLYASIVEAQPTLEVPEVSLCQTCSGGSCRDMRVSLTRILPAS